MSETRLYKFINSIFYNTLYKFNILILNITQILYIIINFNYLFLNPPIST